MTEFISLFYAKAPRNFNYEGESHDFWELIYIDQGKLLITAGARQYVLKAGELAFHKPGEFHAISGYDAPSNYIVTAFVCNAPCMKYFEHKFITLNNRERNCLYELVRHGQKSGVFHRPPSLISPDAPPPFGEIQLMQAYLETFLLLLLQRGESERIQSRVDSYAQQSKKKKLVENVQAYLHAHIEKKVTLTEIAFALGYSVSQLKKQFHAETGRGIIDYFIDLKIDEAKRLIREGNLNLTAIAEKLGYENPSYFSRIFKQRTEMRASEYSRSIGE